MLEAILRSNPRSDFMYVVDTRPKVSPLCLRNGLRKYNLTVMCCMFRWALFSLQGFASWVCSQQKTIKHAGSVLAEPWSILYNGHLSKTLFWCLSQLNAIANRAAGKGYENEDNYSNIKFQFIGIENIHVMRNSQQKMLEGNYHVFLKWFLTLTLFIVETI